MAYKNFTNCTEEQYYEIIYSQDDTNRIKILFNNVELADADEYCEKLTVKNRILPDDGSKRFSLGNFVSKEAELILRDLPSTTTIQDQVSISIGTLVNESNNTYEYVPIGIFNIQDTPVTDQNKVTIKLRDNRVKFDYYYNAKPLIDEKGGKANYYQILDDICTQAGVINKVGHFAGDDIEVSIYDNTITATSYVAKIAEQCGMIPVINRLGELEFINPKSDKATTQIESTATLQNVGSTQVNKIELIGNTTQASTPTPSSPVNVETVTGLQEIKAVGKNLFSSEMELGIIDGTGSNVSNDNGIRTKGYIPIEPNTTYYLSNDHNYNQNLYYYDSNFNYVRYSETTGSFTTPSGVAYLRTRTSAGSVQNDLTTKYMLSKGSTATTYEPYQEQVSEINLGKNLLTTNYFRDVATVTINDTTTNDFTYYGCWGTDLINNANILKILEPSTTYTISFKFKVLERPSSFGQYNTPSICILYGGSQTISFQDARKNTAELDTWLDFSSTFTMPSSLSGYRFLLYNFKDTDNNTTGKIEIAELQIEEGSIATDFAPYFTPIELCKIGTYEDKVFKTTGKNLFNPSLIQIGRAWNNDSNSARAIIIIPAKPSTTYSLSFNSISGLDGVYYFGRANENDSTRTMGNYQVTSSPTTITTTSDTNYIGIQFNKTSITTDDITKCLFQIELGSSASQYEPFGSNNEWYVKKATGKVDLSTCSWTKQMDLSDNYKLFYTSSINNIKYASSNTQLIDNYSEKYIKTIASGMSGTNKRNMLAIDTSAVRVQAIDVPTGLFYYPLASPTYEKLNDTLQEELNSIRLLEGLNNIMSSVPIELEYYVEKTPIRIPLSIIEKYEVGEPYTIERVVYESGVIKYETSDDDTLSTLYLDASNEYIESQEQVDYIKDMLNGFTIDSVNTGRVLGNPAIDAYDLIEVYDDDYDNEPTIFKTFANNTYTYTGINRNTFDTQIGIEERTENVSIAGEANFQKWAKTSINNLEGSIELNAGEIDDLDNRLKETKLIVDTDSARIDTVEESFNEDGSVKALKTTNYTFDADGLRIGKSTDDYNSLQDNTGTYYYEKDTMTGKYTKDGSVQKDMALFGTYYYGIDEEGFDVATFTRDDALFVAQLYNNGTEDGFGHFWNGE